MNLLRYHQATEPKGLSFFTTTEQFVAYDPECRDLLDKLQTKTLLSETQLVKQAKEYVQRNVSAHGRYLTDLEMMRDAFQIMLDGSDRNNLSVGEIASDYVKNPGLFGEKVDCQWSTYWGWFCYEIGGPDDEEAEAYNKHR